MTAPTAARIPDAPESDLDLVVAAEKPVAQGVIRLSPPAGTGLSCRPGSPASTSTPTSPPASSVSTRCDTTVVAGTVDHRDVLLTPAERAAHDTMFLCVSRAAGRRLVLDL